jgi:outer membrane lipoprotein-sorting protein
MRQRTITLTMAVMMAFSLVGAVSAQTDAQAKADEILKQARARIGADAQLKSLTTLSVSITSRRTIGETHLERDLDYDIMLPDKYRRRESRQPFTTITVAQDDNTAVYSVPNPVSSGGDILRENSNHPEAQIRRRADFTRFMLGLLLTGPPSEALEYTYAGEHKDLEGVTDMIDVKGKDGFHARLHIDRSTHHLVMLTYQAKQLSHAVRTVARMAGNAPRLATDDKKLTSEQQAQRQVERWGEVEKRRKQFEDALATAPEVEYRWIFDQHKTVKGLTMPYHLSRQESGHEYEEWEVSAFRINPKLTGAMFGTRK